MSRSRARVGVRADVAVFSDAVDACQHGDAPTSVVERCERERQCEARTQHDYEDDPNPVFHVKPFLPRRSETAGQLVLTSGFGGSV